MKKIILSVVLFYLLASPSLAQNFLKIPGLKQGLSWTNKPISYQIGPASLFVVAGEKTDMFRDPNVTYNTDNAPRLSFTTDSNFVLTAGIHHDFISKWDGGAIVFEADSLHWIKFCFEKDYTGKHRVVSVVTNDISDDCNSVAIPGDQVFYKIAKAGNVITLYYSTDNKKWFLIRHLQFNTDKSTRLGFMAQSPTGKQCKVQFSHISYSTRKISDPYLGK